MASHRYTWRCSVVIMERIGYPPEQSLRKAAYEAAHPDAHVLFCGTYWQAVIEEGAGSITVITRPGLADLLDKLESL
jgi:hypothetical protein